MIIIRPSTIGLTCTGHPDSGAFAAPTSRWCSVSGRLRRRISPNGKTSAPIPKAMRQPKASSWAGFRMCASKRPAAAPTSEATDWLALCQEPTRPRLPGRAASIRNAVVGPTSPPRAKPCTSRQSTRRAGAAGPIRA